MGFAERTRIEIVRQAHFACCLCRKVGTVEVHHIIPQMDGGTNNADNGAPLCPTCHEIYGANPTKRKLIRAARDQWKEICSKRYATDVDRLSQLLDHVHNVDVKVNSIWEVMNRSNNSDGDNLSDHKYLSIGQIVALLIEMRYAGGIKFEKSIQAFYALLFMTVGDKNSESDRSFNETRMEFVDHFGKIMAEAVCAYSVKEYNMDWTVGVLESTLNDAFAATEVLMIMLLFHEDLGRELKLQFTYGLDGRLRASLVNRSAKKATAVKKVRKHRIK